MADVEITNVETYEMHNNAFDEATIEYEKQLAEWRHKVDTAYQAVRDEDPEADLTEVDLSGLEEPVRPDVPPTVSARKIHFREGDEDRGLYVCVLSSATQEEVAAAIRECLDEAASIEETVRAGDTFQV